MIANLYDRHGALVYAFELPNPVTEEGTEQLSECIIRRFTVYVLRGIQWNDHANRHELRYEEADNVFYI